MSVYTLAELDARFAATSPPPALAWLHQQSLLSNAARRRRLIPGLGPRILDVGSGLGQAAADWAAGLRGVEAVIGLDVDPAATAFAQKWTQGLDLPVTFVTGNLYEWAPETPVTGITCRFVLQHLPDVPGALRQFYRWLTPGGIAFIEDVDDGYQVDWPVFPDAWTHVLTAVSTYQQAHGGDRTVGRKIGPWLVDAGFRAQAAVDVQTQITVLTPEDPSIHWIRQKVTSLLPQLQGDGCVTLAEWAAAEAALAAWLPRTVYQSTATVIWTAQRPQ